MDNRRDSTNSCLVSSYSDSYNNSYNNSYIDKCFLKKRNSYNSRKSVLKTNTMIVLWFLILVGILNSVIVFSSAYSIPDSQYDALQDLYNSCDGDNWRWYRNNHSIPWDFTDNSDPCIDNWEGVGCACAVTSTIVCTVVELELIRHRLRGDIPSSISDLSTLVLLDLSANEIEESIPSSITTIETLQALFLLSNEITGKLPSDILSMPKLRVLDVSGNLIAGSIPSEIGNITSLEVLNLNTNLFNSYIPPELGELSSLTVLHLEHNNLFGTIPEEISYLKELEVLALSINQLTGPIPESIRQLKKLQALALEKNSFNGTLPESLYELRDLRILSAGDNRITGLIPESYKDLKELRSITLNNNLLTGPFPSALFNLPKISQIVLAGNNLTGIIPDNFTQIPNLKELQLTNNSFTGPLPVTIGTLANLTIVFMDFNYLTGHIPPEYGNCTHLLDLFLHSNRLSGPIPVEFGNLNYLILLYLYDNQLTGPIPKELTTLYRMTALELTNNLLTGPIPSGFGNNTSALSIIDFQNNHLNGTIPTSLGELRKLTDLTLGSNALTGSIPSELGQLRLSYLELQDNYLTGEIPIELSDLVTLSSMNLSFNSVSGSLSDELVTGWYSIEAIDLSSNLFTGQLPNGISTLTQLKQFYIRSNKFTGQVVNVFNATLQGKLINIDLSNNQFTGNLPKDPFLSGRLQSFAAVINCLVGPIPAEVCQAYSLETLVLDGMNAAGSCHTNFFPALIDSYALFEGITDGIPPCLFNLTKLQTLHLSGNVITGKLPDVEISDTLHDLSLSYNLLKGTIPIQYQEKSWTNLDLSFNRLTGTFSERFSSYSSNSSLKLQNNRLSGSIPATLKYAPDISILYGNMFSCDLDEDSLPVHDDDRDDYECGSDTFNLSAYAYVGSSLILLALLVLLYFIGNFKCDSLESDSYYSYYEKRYIRIQKFMSIYGKNYTIGSNSQVVDNPINEAKVKTMEEGKEESVFNIEYTKGLSAVQEFGEASNDIRRSATILMMYIVLVLFPIYLALTKYYNTYTYQYAWTYSVAFLGGKEAGIIILATYLVLLLLIYYIYHHTRYSLDYKTAIKESLKDESLAINDNRMSPWTKSSRYIFGTRFAFLLNNKSRLIATRRHMLCIFVVATLNLIVVLGVNVLYVYIYLYYRRTVVILMVIILAVFKLVWNIVVVYRLVEYTKPYYMQKQVTQRLGGNGLAEMDTFTQNPMNYEPGMVSEALGGMSPSYFGDTFQDLDLEGFRPAADSRAKQEKIKLLLSEISALEEATHESRNMKFRAFLTCFNYVLVPVIASLALDHNCLYYLIFSPPTVSTSYNVIQCGHVTVVGNDTCIPYRAKLSEEYTPPFAYTYQCSSTFVTSYAAIYIAMFLLIGFLLPAFQLYMQWYYQRLQKYLIAKQEMNRENGERREPSNFDTLLLRTVDAITPEILKPLRYDIDKRPKLRLFYKEMYLSELIGILSVLTTFGAAFPPLAIAVYISLLIKSWYHQMLIGRIVILSEESKSIGRHYMHLLQKELKGLPPYVFYSVSELLLFVAVFLGAFVFDTYGDATSASHAVWPLIAILLFPIALFLIVPVARKVGLWNVKRKKIAMEAGFESQGENDRNSRTSWSDYLRDSSFFGRERQNSTDRVNSNTKSDDKSIEMLTSTVE